MKKGRLGRSEQCLAVGPVVSLSMSLSTAMWKVGDVVSFGKSRNEAAAFMIFSLFFYCIRMF